MNQTLSLMRAVGPELRACVRVRVQRWSEGQLRECRCKMTHPHFSSAQTAWKCREGWWERDEEEEEEEKEERGCCKGGAFPGRTGWTQVKLWCQNKLYSHRHCVFYCKVILLKIHVFKIPPTPPKSPFSIEMNRNAFNTFTPLQKECFEKKNTKSFLFFYFVKTYTVVTTL